MDQVRPGRDRSNSAKSFVITTSFTTSSIQFESSFLRRPLLSLPTRTMIRSARTLHPARFHLRPTVSRSPILYARTLSTTRCLRNAGKTSLSTPEEEGHPKISAVPFHFGQEDADSRLKIAALLATGTSTIVFFLLPWDPLMTLFRNDSNDPQPNLRDHPPLPPAPAGIGRELSPRIRNRREHAHARRHARRAVARVAVQLCGRVRGEADRGQRAAGEGVVRGEGGECAW